jgi:hypothetical protein
MVFTAALLFSKIFANEFCEDINILGRVLNLSFKSVAMYIS